MYPNVFRGHLLKKTLVYSNINHFYVRLRAVYFYTRVIKHVDFLSVIIPLWLKMNSSWYYQVDLVRKKKHYKERVHSVR